MLGNVVVPKWLAVDDLLSQFGSTRSESVERCRRFVREGIGKGIWDDLRQQIYLGDEAFVERTQAKAKLKGDALTVPKIQRRGPAPPLAEIAASSRDRDTAIVTAYGTGAYTYRKIAEHFCIHLATVGRIVRRGMPLCET